MTNKKVVIWNLVAFGIIHFFLEVVSNVGSTMPNNIAFPVIIQYLISWWIIKPKIDKKDKNALIKYTWIVSLSVFAIRVLLGFILGLILVAA